MNINEIYKISQFIDWNLLWEELETSLDIGLFDEDDDSEIIEKINQFKRDTDVELFFDECEINDKGIHIVFTESGGQNESDNQGWSRDYFLTFNLDFELLDIRYEQG